MPGHAQGPLRILEVVHAFPPHALGGTELYTYSLASEFRRLGHEVTVLFPVSDVAAPQGGLREGTFGGIPLVQLNNLSPPSFPTAYLRPELDRSFLKILDSRRFDLVHFQHVIGTSAGWIRLARGRGLATALKLDDMFFYCPRIHLVTSDGTYCREGPAVERCLRCVWKRRPALDPPELEQRRAWLGQRSRQLRRAIAEADFVHATSRFLRDSCQAHGYTNPRFEARHPGSANFLSSGASRTMACTPHPSSPIRKGVGT